ncbi:MAG: SDR family oxidoreductase [Paracoccaceae bacterium]
MQHEFADQIVVITGASAGIGRATARAFARKGAMVALIARDMDALAATRAEILAGGGRAEVFALDVADASAVFTATEEIEARCGPIDIWINNAMATVFAPVAELSPDELRRVTEVTYLGTAHGTMAALHHMRQRNRGVIVQVSSSLAYRGIPLQSAYCGAKHAARGFTDALRSELLHDNSGVAITAVNLPAVNTPQFDWARSKRRKLPRPVAPVYAASAAARAILQATRHPHREYWLGTSTLLTIMGNMLAPRWLDGVLARNAVTGQDREALQPEGRPDNLYSPVTGIHRTDGPFGREARRHAMLYPAPVARIGVVMLGAGIAAGLGGIAATMIAAKNHRR